LLRAAGFRRELSRISDVVLLTVVGGLIAPAVAASVGTAAVWSAGMVPPRQAATVWSTWWLGDGIGTVVFAPLLLTLRAALTQLQLYSASVGLTALVLAAATTGRRESEERVRQRTAELESSNCELGAFAYTVSHDLRAPLRAMHGFARMLAARDGHALSSEG